MLKIVILASIFVLCVDGISFLSNRYCYSTDIFRPQIKTFGKQTPYDRIRGHIFNPFISTCKPARFWYLGRHGSRFPSVADEDNLLSSTDTIHKEIFKNYLASKTKLCLLDALNIYNWKINSNFTLPTKGVLTETGWNELSKLAARLQNLFPTLLPKTYSSEHYYFRHSPAARTSESAKAFARGLFGANNYDSVNYEGGFSPDNFLVPFTSCPDWVEIMHNVTEYNAFTQSCDYLQMVKQVSERLGFSGSQQLSANMVDKLITHCKYEQLYNHIIPSPFCSAFSYANHEVNEYYRDLQLYYLFGYGEAAKRKTFESMSCYFFQSMLQFLQSDNESEQKAKIWFGHDATVQLTLSTLGLYEDSVPLTASNFAQQTSRKWKTSYLTPMAGNLAVIRFDCESGDNDILFLHNEKPLQIPGCMNGVCKQSLIMERYGRFLNANCDAVFCTNLNY